MAFPTPTVPSLSGIIGANQFNQATNANIIGTITAQSNTATNPYVPNLTPITSPPVNIAGVISANSFTQATNANIVGTIMKNPVSGAVQGLGGLGNAAPTPVSTAFSAEPLKKGIFANPTMPPVQPSKGFDINENDWRVRLQLAPNANYLYMDARDDSHVLYPLRQTNGVIFPYTPTINLSYQASYDPVDLTHTNYKFFQYRNSSVGDISISAEFTAQDTNEARYLLAVIHFFKSVTKMFYGNDKDPMKGTPPPLCYLTGYGQYQFSKHPLVITNFTYSLPNDVDYIRASLPANTGGQNLGSYSPVTKSAAGGGRSGVGGIFSTIISKVLRRESAQIPVGAEPARPMFISEQSKEATYVPTKMTIQLGASPMISRFDSSNKFSVKDYAKGDLLKKGIW